MRIFLAHFFTVLVFGFIGYLIGGVVGFFIGLALAAAGLISIYLDEAKARRASDDFHGDDFSQIPTPEESAKIFSQKPSLLKMFLRRRETESTRMIVRGETLFKADYWDDSKPLILSYNRKLSPDDQILHIRVFAVYRNKNSRAKRFYIDAWCYERDAFRTYRLDRIVGAFSPETGEEVKDIDSLLSILNPTLPGS